MGAKITLTGVRDGELRKTENYYAFEMTIGGSSTAPKGLPVPSPSVQYTIFLSLEAGKKAKLETVPDDQKWLVQGEITLDLSMDECPGEIGVVTYQISELSENVKGSEVKSPEASKESVAAVLEVAAAVEPASSEAPDVRLVSIEDIYLPEKFQDAWLNPKKTEPVRKWIQKHGQIDRPLDVYIENGEFWLEDGYRRYALAQEAGITEVPVRILGGD